MARPTEPSRKSGSFLIRIWEEPSANEATKEAVRTYVRNLQTGTEQHLSDTAEIEKVLMEEFDKEEAASIVD